MSIPETSSTFPDHLLQDTVSHTKEHLKENTSAARDGATRQLAQARLEEPAECSCCPICLGDIKDTAYVAFCLHRFCFPCIQEWAKMTPSCPLCRQPFNLLLHSVQADDFYKEYVVPSSSRRRRNVLRERDRSRSPQRHENMNSLADDDAPSTGRRGFLESQRTQRHDAAPRPSNSSSQRAPAPSASQERTRLSAGERLARAAAAAYRRTSRAVQQAWHFARSHI